MKSSNIIKKNFYLEKIILFVFVSLCFVGPCIWWNSYNYVSSDELWDAIQGSKISSSDRLLLHHLVYDDKAWSSGLIGTYLSPGLEKRIVWQSKYQNNSGGFNHIFLLNQYLEPGVKPLFPVTCIITDKDFKLQAWETFILSSSGINSVDLSQDTENLLIVTAVCGWTYGMGIHKYALYSNKITDFGNVQFRPFKSGENPETLLVPFMSESEFQSLNLNFSNRIRRMLTENRKLAR